MPSFCLEYLHDTKRSAKGSGNQHKRNRGDTRQFEANSKRADIIETENDLNSRFHSRVQNKTFSQRNLSNARLFCSVCIMSVDKNRVLTDAPIGFCGNAQIIANGFRTWGLKFDGRISSTFVSVFCRTRSNCCSFRGCRENSNVAICRFGCTSLRRCAST